MITVGFSTTGKLLSRLIRLVTRGKVSHAWVAFDDEFLRIRFVAQAESWGYEVRPWRRWLRENRRVAEFSLPCVSPDRLRRALLRLARRLGAPYDWESAGLSGLFRWFRILLRGRLRATPRRMMCSEAVVTFLQDAGVSVAADMDPERTTPAELYEAALANPEHFLSVRAPGGLS